MTRRPLTFPVSRFSFPAWLSVWVVIAGCATVRGLAFSEPDVTLKQINVTRLGLTGGTLDLVFDVYNPNSYRLRSTRVEIGLDLEERHFGDALLERPLDLSPENHSEVIVPVRFEWTGVGAGARALLTKQAVGYGVSGRFLVSTPLGDRGVTVRGRGDVPLRKLL